MSCDSKKKPATEIPERKSHAFLDFRFRQFDERDDIDMRVLSKEEEKDDVEVTWEDQQRINTFSKLNTRARNIEAKLSELKQEKEALDDLSTELELSDEGEPVLYKVGETYLHMPLSRAQKRLEHDQADVDEKISELTTNIDQCETEMKELKVTLYAKFGRAINLDE